MKRILIALLLAVLLSGCTSTDIHAETQPALTAAAASTGDPATATPPSETAVESPQPAKRVEPYPASLQMNALTDCMFPAGFDASGVYLNDDGALVVRMTVYDYELFDLVDVSLLREGDILVIEGKEVPVKSVVHTDLGSVLVNGGYDDGGYTLNTEENGVYFATEADDAKHYYALGEITLPIDQNFVFTDSSDLDAPEKISYAGDFLTDMKSSTASFSPYSTTVTVENGFITSITQIYVP